MNYCLNPTCIKPKNPSNALVCQNCGAKLLLQDCYQILGILGKGGFGTTFAARNISMPEDSLCVIKQLRPMSNDSGIMQMAKVLFDREAKILGTVLRHPQVPKLIDYFEEDYRFYLVQEYIKGHNLHREIKMNGCFSEAGVKQFLSEILPIMQYLHAKKILHRDIKPANLIRRSDDCQLVLIDFGAVKHEVNSIFADNGEDTDAFTAFAVGTSGFAPPEQLARRPVYASDIYALGITCIYLLTGKTPRQLDSDPLTGEIYWQESVKVSEKFAQVLEKMLALSLSDRYQSVEQVLHALQMLPYEESMKQSLTTTVKGKKVENRQHRRNQANISSLSPNFDDKLPSNLSLTAMSVSANFPTNSISSAPFSRTATPASRANLAAETKSQHLQQRSREINRSEAGETAAEKPKKPKLSTKALLEAYQQGQRDFAEQALVGVSLPKVRLPGINLYEANLTQANLEGSDLSEANLGRICFCRAMLKNVNFSAAFLAYANLGDADLRGANLSGANLKFANLIGANLCGANLSGAHITKVQLAGAKTNWFTIFPTGKRRFW